MKWRQIRSELENSLDLLVENNISIYNQNIHITQSNKIIKISWKQTSQTQAKPYRFGTLEQYKSILADNSYTCILIDGSIFRISYTFQRESIISHSLWYYPCPFNIPYDDIKTDPLLDLVEIYSEAGFEYCNFKGPLRFDYDLTRSISIYHPASHVHICNADCRIPAKAPISPGAFFKFIFFNFYPDIWEENKFIKDLPEHRYDKTIVLDESKLIHFSWK
ncbi:DUF2290 domain-containing protein [bacterium]|nr:DUF2290 domain-containing protein [bacterium]